MSRVLTQEEIEALLAAGPYVPAPKERYRVVVEAGCAELTPEEIAALKPGSVIRLDRRASAPVAIVANAVVVAYGKLVSDRGVAATKVTALHGPGDAGRGGPR